MKRYALGLLVIALCSGQMCGSPDTSSGPRGIPQGVYKGTQTIAATITVYSADGQQQIQQAAPQTQSLVMEFGPDGDLLNTSKVPVAPGDYVSKNYGFLNSVEEITSVIVGDNEVAVASRVTATMTDPTNGQTVTFAGTTQDQFLFLEPNSVQVHREMNLVSSVYQGEVAQIKITTTATLYP